MRIRKFRFIFAGVMVRICNRDSRIGFPKQRPLRGVLPHSKSFNLLALAACLAALSGCEIFGGADIGNDTVEREYVDSSNFTISIVERCSITESSGGSISGIHFFLYDGDGLKQLEHDWTEEGMTEEINFRSSKKDKIVVAVANCPHEFDISKLGRFEAIEHLQMSFVDDDCVSPVMSGVCAVSPLIRSELVLKPLMGRIILEGITNNMSGYKRLEDPRVFLTGASEKVELLRNDGFHTSEFLEGRDFTTALPCDVGMFPQHPGTEMFCYPDDSTDGITLVLECEIKGKTRCFEKNVSPIGRNETKRVEFTIESEDRFYWNVY